MGMHVQRLGSQDSATYYRYVSGPYTTARVAAPLCKIVNQLAHDGMEENTAC